MKGGANGMVRIRRCVGENGSFPKLTCRLCHDIETRPDETLAYPLVAEMTSGSEDGMPPTGPGAAGKGWGCGCGCGCGWPCAG